MDSSESNSDTEIKNKSKVEKKIKKKKSKEKKEENQKEIAKKEDNQNEINVEMDEKEEKIDGLINSVFKDKSKKPEIIEKLRPFFSLKVVPQREIERVYSAVEDIPPEKIKLFNESIKKEEKYEGNNVYAANSKSVGLSDFDLDLSVNILGHKQSLKYDNKENNLGNNNESSSRRYCIHSNIVKIFRIMIDFKDIKLSKKVMEELEEVRNSNATDKKILLEKLVDKFGLYVPLELIVGGRINYSFEGNSAKEIREIHSLLQKQVKGKVGGGIKFISGSGEINYNKGNNDNDSKISLDKVENLSTLIIGGDITYEKDFHAWIQSFNLDNLQIIEYKSLQPIYSFIPGLESKLSICLEKYEDIVLKEIHSLMETDFKMKEKEIFEGSSETNNFWKVGITQEQYKSFVICKKKIIKNLCLNLSNEIEDEENEKKVDDVICGEIPDGFIICGWILKTNANSNYYDVIANWERKKAIGIIGNEFFKFKVNLAIEDENINEDVNIDWSLEIFCIHNNYLVEYNKKSEYKKNHYFINCDCDSQNKEECYYNNYYKNKITFTNSRKVNKKPKKKIVEKNQILPNCEKKSKNYDFLFNNHNRFNNKI